ncbi:IF-2 protein [Myxococcaceae bacterium JPH2]|nr:IF-2 protein [Myxococcaceae bacterium JPH2]
MNVNSPQGFGHRARRAFMRTVTLLVILTLGVGILFLLGKINARTFTLTVDNGALVVMKGRNLPTGAAPYQPGDARLADAYAPIPLEGQDATLLTLQSYSERDELDRALFPLLESLARPRIASDEPARVDRGLYYLRRAEKLSGLTDEQRRALQGMLADVAYYQARQKLEDARRLVSESLAQLKLAAESQNRHARNANQMLSTVGPPARDLEEALRRAVHTESGPQEAQDGATAPTRQVSPSPLPPSAPGAPAPAQAPATPAQAPDAGPTP